MMNRRPPGLETVKAIEGFLQFKSAEGLSPRTIECYRHDLNLWIEHQGNIMVDLVTSQMLREYLSFMLTEYVPRRITGNNNIKLSPKTVRNIWVTLSAFFHWASDEFNIVNPMKRVSPPHFVTPQIEPFTKEEVEKILKVCDYCNEAQSEKRRKFTMRRVTSFRDRAIILTLLDSGIRASELCSLKINDIDMHTGKTIIRAGMSGGAKGGKGRIVFLGKSARRAIWRYLATRDDGDDPESYLFIGKNGRQLNRDALRQVIHSLGEKAGINKTFPHRFRHTFAITYLRAGGDLFTLQALLGHSSLDVVQIYARIAEIDIEQAHRRSSPVDNWRL